jgi:hypothetical protein
VENDPTAVSTERNYFAGREKAGRLNPAFFVAAFVARA